MRFIRRALLSLDRTLARATDSFELTRGRVPAGTLISSVWPRLAVDLVKQIRKSSVIVSGTNGKSTVCRFLSGILRQAGYSTLQTDTWCGSLEETASALIHSASGHGTIRADHGVFGFDEDLLDEGLNLCAPQVVVLNNLHSEGHLVEGSVEATLNAWHRHISSMPPDRALLVNADDPALCGGFIRGVPPRIVYFGVEDERLRTTSERIKQSLCYKCKIPLNYRFISMGHLGDYTCGRCGWERPLPAVYAIHVEMEAEESRFRIVTPVGPLDARLCVPGVHNVYNAVAAAAAAVSLGIGPAVIRKGLEQTVPGPGRHETLTINNRSARLIRIKNAASLDEELRLSLIDRRRPCYLFLVEDGQETGSDMAWVWETDFERVAGRSPLVFVSGDGASELMLRFKHAGIQVAEFIPDVDEAFHYAMRNMPAHARLWALATDTPLIALRQELSELGVLNGSGG